VWREPLRRTKTERLRVFARNIEVQRGARSSPRTLQRIENQRVEDLLVAASLRRGGRACLVLRSDQEELTFGCNLSTDELAWVRDVVTHALAQGATPYR
jgi:hypothetical protein